jgi:hypothetical protein
MVEIQMCRHGGGPDFEVLVTRKQGPAHVTASLNGREFLTEELVEAEWADVESALADIQINLMPQPPFPLVSGEYALRITSDVLTLHVQWGPAIAAGWEFLPRAFEAFQHLLFVVQRRIKGEDGAEPAA